LYKSPGYLIALFSSATTKSFGNDMTAIKTAQMINDLFKEHNKKFRDKIDYGMALNLGELIMSKEEGGKVMFTNLGNTVALTKKVADLAKEEVLMSMKMNTRVSSKVKTEKENRQGMDVHDFLNREKDREKAKKDEPKK
jgi:class 3 adenylate cyclase